MEKDDARKMSRETLLERRQQVICLYNEKMPVMKIVESTGLSWPAVNAAIKKFKMGGNDALLPSKRGRKLGTDRAINEEQELVLRKLLYRSRPNLLKPMISRRKLNLYLWDRDAVAELISRKCGIKLSKRCVDKYLVRWGLPVMEKNQRPLARCTSDVQRKLEQEETLKRIFKEKTSIYWVNASKLSPPDKMLDKLNRQLTLVLATDNRGKEYWLFYKGRYSEAQQIDFLQTLLKQARSRIVVVRDNAKYYTEKSVSAWLQENDIEIVPTPPSARR